MSTLACLVAGFEIVARHVELILLPLILDLFLWLGPRLSIGPITGRLKSSMLASLGDRRDVATLYAMMGAIMDEIGEAFNLFSALNPGPLSGVPVLMPSRMETGRPFGAPLVIKLDTLLVALLLAGVLAVVGLGLNAIYLRGVARRVLKETEAQLPGPLSVLDLWLRFIKLGLVYVGLAIAVSLVLSGIIGAVALISEAVANMLMVLMFSVIIFTGVSAAVHLMFTIPGMVQLRRDILPAMKESLLLSRGDFLNVVFLLGLIFVVSQGLNVVWMLPKLDSWSTLIGLAGHAFVSTALTVAVFVFYQERLQFLEVLKQLFQAQAEAHPVPGK